MDKKEDGIISCLGNTQVIYAGSSLKFCYVAEGLADVYLRNKPSMEWDTAAGHCIAECAGGKVCDLEGMPLRYNKESLENTGFLCTCKREEVIDSIIKCIFNKNL